jgi:hypothetical protein
LSNVCFFLYILTLSPANQGNLYPSTFTLLNLVSISFNYFEITIFVFIQICFGCHVGYFYTFDYNGFNWRMTHYNTIENISMEKTKVFFYEKCAIILLATHALNKPLAFL